MIPELNLYSGEEGFGQIQLMILRIFGKVQEVLFLYLSAQLLSHRREIMKYLFVPIILLFIFLAPSVFCEEQDDSWSAIVLSSIEKSKPVKMETVGLKQTLVDIDFSQAGIDAAIEMWRRGKIEYLELVWWRQENRTVRTVILSLFYTQLKMTTSDTPQFKSYLRKFFDDERMQRSEELDFVFKNEKQLNQLLASVLVKDKDE
jgi:hypothetical protein